MYIDPGYGALLLQGLMASVLGALFVGRQRIAALLRKLTGGSANAAQGETRPTSDPDPE
jgi:hypothetical protein